MGNQERNIILSNCSLSHSCPSKSGPRFSQAESSVSLKRSRFERHLKRELKGFITNNTVILPLVRVGSLNTTGKQKAQMSHMVRNC